MTSVLLMFPACCWVACHAVLNFFAVGLTVTAGAMALSGLYVMLVPQSRVIGGVVLVIAGSVALIPLIGTEFIPVTDESQFRIVLRAPVGQRVEKTEQQTAEIERVIREQFKPTSWTRSYPASGCCRKAARRCLIRIRGPMPRSSRYI